VWHIEKMECPNCEKDIKAKVEAEIITEEGNEFVALFLTCEHCKTEMYGTAKTTVFDTI